MNHIFEICVQVIPPYCRYSWCSERLINSNLSWRLDVNPDDLIPLETKLHSSQSEFGQWMKRIVVGHNVSFDRSFIKEQYFIKVTSRVYFH